MSGGHDARCKTFPTGDPRECSCRSSDGRTPQRVIDADIDDTQPMRRVTPTGPPCETAS